MKRALKFWSQTAGNIYQLLNSAFIRYEEFCRSRTVLSTRPRWITPSEFCRILHILRKPNSIVALLFIQNIYSFLKEFHHFALCFSAHQPQPCPQVIIQYMAKILPKFGEQQLVMVNYACGFNQSETGKYFE